MGGDHFLHSCFVSLFTGSMKRPHSAIKEGRLPLACFAEQANSHKNVFLNLSDPGELRIRVGHMRFDSGLGIGQAFLTCTEVDEVQPRAGEKKKKPRRVVIREDGSAYVSSDPSFGTVEGEWADGDDTGVFMLLKGR